MNTSYQNLVALARLPDPPRDVVRRRGVSLPLRFVLCMLVPHVWVGVFLIAYVLLVCGISFCGQDRQAVVSSRQYVRAKSTTSCLIRYTYDEAGKPYTDSEALSSAAYAQHAPGSTLPIRSFHVMGYGRSRVLAGGSTTYLLHFAYTDRAEGVHSRQMVVRRPEFDDAGEGDRITVFYNPLKPRASVIYKYSEYAGRDRYGQLLAE